MEIAPHDGEEPPLRRLRQRAVVVGKELPAAAVEMMRGASLLRVHLETGRTHQIRVHFAALRHPCVGDLTYGADPTLAAAAGLQRQWLHAVGLGFEHPGTGEYVVFKSPYAADLEAALERCRDGF